MRRIASIIDRFATAPLKWVRRRAVARVVHTSEGGGATAAAPGVVAGAQANSLATLLARHVLHDGELVILILKPSMWFIVLQSLRFIAAALIVMIAAKIYQDALPMHTPTRVAAVGVVAISGRLMWSILQWMGRFYILTDLRVLRLQGVFAIDIFDCPLRKIARLRRVTTTRERLLRLGSIEIIPFDDDLPIGLWQTLARPRAVYHEIVTAINRAKQGGL